MCCILKNYVFTIRDIPCTAKDNDNTIKLSGHQVKGGGIPKIPYPQRSLQKGVLKAISKTYLYRLGGFSYFPYVLVAGRICISKTTCIHLLASQRSHTVHLFPLKDDIRLLETERRHTLTCYSKTTYVFLLLKGDVRLLAN